MALPKTATATARLPSIAQLVPNKSRTLRAQSLSTMRRAHIREASLAGQQLATLLSLLDGCLDPNYR